MDAELKAIINLMNEVQIAAIGDGDPQQGHKGYIEDVNARIGEIERKLALLKHELKTRFKRLVRESHA
jgi:hypothetical protein